jgi:hypothetical protein
LLRLANGKAPIFHFTLNQDNYPRGSGVFAAWFDGKTWDKTLQKDKDGAAVNKQAQGFVFVSIAGHRQLILIFLEL